MLLFLLLLCVLILARSARSLSFDVRLHGSSSKMESLFIKTLNSQDKSEELKFMEKTVQR